MKSEGGLIFQCFEKLGPVQNNTDKGKFLRNPVVIISSVTPKNGVQSCFHLTQNEMKVKRCISFDQVRLTTNVRQ